jgi:hypothetical protein
MVGMITCSRNTPDPPDPLRARLPLEVETGEVTSILRPREQKKAPLLRGGA